MKPSLAALTLVFALWATAYLASPAFGQDDEAGYENAIARATQIIKTKIIPEYQTARWHYRSSSRLTFLTIL